MMDVDLLPREVLAEVVLATKTKGVTAAVAPALSNAIFDALERRGYVIAEANDVVDPPDEHLRTLKYIRKCVKESIEGSESARDISSLTKRLGDIAKEIVAVEDRIRVDAKSKAQPQGGTNTGGTTRNTKRASKSGQIDI